MLEEDQDSEGVETGITSILYTVLALSSGNVAFQPLLSSYQRVVEWARGVDQYESQAGGTVTSVKD